MSCDDEYFAMIIIIVPTYLTYKGLPTQSFGIFNHGDLIPSEIRYLIRIMSDRQYKNRQASLYR